VIDNFVSSSVVASLREDLQLLGQAGRFQVATSQSSNGEEDSLRSALTCRPNMESDAFGHLYNDLQELREELQQLMKYCF
jgi:hypothetical protein